MSKCSSCHSLKEKAVVQSLKEGSFRNKCGDCLQIKKCLKKRNGENKMSNELVKKDEMKDIWSSFATEEVNKPRIYINQGSSESVKKGNAKAGSLTTSTGDVLTQLGDTVPFVVVGTYKSVLERVGPRENKYHDWTPEYENKISQEVALPWKDRKFFPNLNFIVLLKDRMTDESVIPFEVGFTRTNYNMALRLNTMIAQLDKTRYLPFTKVFEMGTAEVSHNGFDWFQYTVANSELELTEEQKKIAYTWYQRVNEGKASKEEKKEIDDIPF